MTSWRDDIRVYADRRVLTVMVLGFSSGLPLALTLGTLSIWLAKEGISKTSIGLFTLVGLPYALKFLWAPLMDRLPLPLFGRLGRRRGWTLLVQLALIGAILMLGASDPRADPYHTAICAVAVAFLSASQDIVIDAYRVELLDESQYGAGAAMSVLGYRLGMLASGAGAMFLAEWYGWFVSYAVMAALMGVGMAMVLVAGEAQPAPRRHHSGLAALLAEAVLGPFREFLGRPGWLGILLVVVLYKLGEVMAGVMSNPLYIELGFSLSEIATISKGFGLGASILGGFLGGIAVHHFGIRRALLLTGILQSVSIGFFILQAKAGHDILMLAGTIGLENLTAGMATAAFVAYLSSLCNLAYTATQYALLTSLAAVGRTMLSSSAGWFADHFTWTEFFLMAMGATVPGLVLLAWMMRRELKNPSSPIASRAV